MSEETPQHSEPSDTPIGAPEPEVLNLFLSCPKGIEGLLLEEVRGFNPVSARETIGGVYATGDLRFAYRCCLWSRMASRVLLPLATFDVSGGPDALYAAAHAIHWPDLFDVRNTFAIDVAGRSKAVAHTHYAALKVKDAVADRFRAAVNRRPDVDAISPDVRIHLHLGDARTTLSLDLSGEALHRRGYRNAAVQAPLKENLAAALLIRAGWPAIAAAGGALFDPFCGSGTLVIEAGWIAGDVAPNHLRERWGFSHWMEHQPRIWRELREDALARKEHGLKNLPPLFGRDRDPQAIRIARANGARAGLTGKVDFIEADATAAAGVVASSGLVIGNPPYGERLSDEAELIKLHSFLGARVKQDFAGWSFGLFTGRPDLGHRLGLRAQKIYSFYNGALPCKLLLMDVLDHRERAPVAESPWPTAPRAEAQGDEAATDSAATDSAELTADEEAAYRPQSFKAPNPEATAEFVNRLRKNYKHLSKWAKRNEVSCYRLYDADLPSYAVAVDLYSTPAQRAEPPRSSGAELRHPLASAPTLLRSGTVSQTELHAIVQEYAPPKTIEPAVAEARLRTALLGIAEVLQLPSSHLHYKLRRAQKGNSQYQKQSAQERYFVATEHGAKLWVNFDDYLDTGLFLDHRPMRHRLQKEASGKRFLNLFCYTGAATIHAAIGGAASTVSVDLSNTYLDWLGQNLELNGLVGDGVEGRAVLPQRLPTHAIVRADCLTWLALQAEATHKPQFDVIFCDPPTFSNSKKMEDTWDVQRDHLALLKDASTLLAPGGVLYFSCNRQRFKLDVDGLQSAGLKVQDITAQTLDEDFRRPPPPHRAWRISR